MNIYELNERKCDFCTHHEATRDDVWWKVFHLSGNDIPLYTEWVIQFLVGEARV